MFYLFKKHMLYNMLHTDKNSQKDLRYNSDYIDPDCYDKSGSTLKCRIFLTFDFTTLTFL